MQYYRKKNPALWSRILVTPLIALQLSIIGVAVILQEAERYIRRKFA